ncbi:hypothetical protein Bbelb_166970 [Branchiostoma belcheri]|nr:hypothetical protein Bbelb_166970 [Branchiostoma belcheri]
MKRVGLAETASDTRGGWQRSLMPTIRKQLKQHRPPFDWTSARREPTDGGCSPQAYCTGRHRDPASRDGRGMGAADWVVRAVLCSAAVAGLLVAGGLRRTDGLPVLGPQTQASSDESDGYKSAGRGVCF